MFVQKT